VQYTTQLCYCAAHNTIVCYCAVHNTTVLLCSTQHNCVLLCSTQHNCVTVQHTTQLCVTVQYTTQLSAVLSRYHPQAITRPPPLPTGKAEKFPFIKRIFQLTRYIQSSTAPSKLAPCKYKHPNDLDREQSIFQN